MHRLDVLQRELAALIDTATDDERNELREVQPTGWRRGGGVMLQHGNAAEVLELIATAEDEELGGGLPDGSALNLRNQLHERLVRTARP